ncbi:hypothetical protein BGX34_008517 [Mortierella sp. NVP85]|nr:hypothetical protein BGX34_008517 [Mortierella sp. NVP85]
MIIDANSSLIDHRREAHPSSALAIPEIVSNVVRYVPLYHMPACARVSKSWYQAFMPFIWENISLIKSKPSLLEAVNNHRHLVKTLTIHTLMPRIASLRFPNLKSLSIRSSKAEQRAEFILNHSDITALELLYLKSVPQSALWDTLFGFRHLRELRLTGVIMDRKDTDAFWQICTLIERGVFYDVYVADQSSLSSVEFPRMKELNILTFRSVCAEVSKAGVVPLEPVFNV